MPAGFEKFSAVSIVLAPAIIFLAYAWWRSPRTTTQHQIATGVSAGVGSIFIAILLGIPALFLAIGQEPLGLALVRALPGSGINEELAKALICAHLVFRAKNFREPGDILLLCMLIGFGFALYENIGYLSTSKADAIGLAYLRAVTATMMHLSLAVLMGAAAIHTVRTGNFAAFAGMVVVQMGLHGAYNFPLLYAAALSKAHVLHSQGLVPWLIAANGVVLVVCLIAAMVALNSVGLQRPRRPYGNDGKGLVVGGGVALVLVAIATAIVLNLLGNELVGVRRSLVHSYLAFCGPPLILGIEMILNAWRVTPMAATARPPTFNHISVPPVQRMVQPRAFGRRTVL